MLVLRLHQKSSDYIKDDKTQEDICMDRQHSLYIEMPVELTGKEFDMKGIEELRLLLGGGKVA